MYFAKYLSISSLSITLFCKIKPNTIHLTIIINATIGIKEITCLSKKLLTYLLNCNKCIEKNMRDNDRSDRTKQLLK